MEVTRPNPGSAATGGAGEQGPSCRFFDTDGTAPGINSDVEITISLNGRLIRVERGAAQGKKGIPMSWEELYGVNWEEFDNLIGRLLTLCDATFTDPIQRKAFKDMVRQHVKEWVNNISVDAAADAGMAVNRTAPFVGGVLDQPGGLFGVEGGPTE